MWGASLIHGLGDLLTKSTRLLLIPIYVHALTSSELGMLAICQAITTGSWALLRFGAGQFAQRFILAQDQAWAGETSSNHPFLSTLWWFRMLVGSLLACVIVALLYMSYSIIFPNIPFVLLALAVGTGNWRAGLTITEFGLIGQGRALAYRVLTFIVFLTSILLILTLVFVYGMGVWGAVLGEFLALGFWILATGLWHTWLSRPKFGKLKWNSFKEFSIPIVPHTVFMWGLMSADRLILSSLVAPEQIGVYDIAYLLGSGIAVFGTALLLPWLPVFYQQSDKPKAGDYFKRRALSQSIICLAITLTANIFTFEICSLMASTYASQATPLMQIILPATLLLMLNAIFIKPLIHQKKTTTISLLSGVGFTINIALNFILVPHLGVFGSAIATITAYAAMALACVVLSNHYLDLKWNLKTSAILRVLTISIFVFTLGFLFPLEVTLTTLLLKLLLALFCWMAFFLRFNFRNEQGGFPISLCLSPLQP